MEQVELAIKNSLETFNFQNAIFLAERLAVSSHPEAMLTLARIHYQMGNKAICKSILDSCSDDVVVILLYANASIDLDQFQDGETSLRRWLSKSISVEDYYSSAVYYTIGKICKAVGRLKEAREALITAIEFDALNFTAFQLLSDLGTPIIPTMDDLLQAKARKETDLKKPVAPIPIKRNPLTKEDLAKRRVIERSTKSVNSGRAPLTSTYSTKHSTASSTTEEVKKRPRDTTAPEKAPPAKKKTVESLTVIHKIMMAYSALAMFNSKQALEIIDTLPLAHTETGLVMGMAAKCHFELHQYSQAVEIYKKIRETQPYRLHGMDIYGTCLWHLKKKVELSFLGKELEEIDRKAPQTWCVIGNYFSILQEHDSAIKAFKRAVQVDPRFTYGHTLMGHEYLSNDDLEQASRCFKLALQFDHRHYNAIFGLGLIERKQEKFALAEYHFRQALEISPENGILLDTLGSVIQKDENRAEEALECYDRALALDPKQRVYILHRASLLFSMGEYNMVIQILEKEIQNSKPESSVYFLLGKAYALSGDTQQAVMAMTLAQDFLEHKSSSIIKDAIEKLFVKDDGDNFNVSL